MRLNASRDSRIEGYDLFYDLSTIILSFAGQILSLFVILVICLNKQLQTPCFKFIAVAAVGSFFAAYSFFISAVISFNQYEDSMVSGLQCILISGLTAMFGIPFHASMTCVVALDRLISVLAPIKYRTLGRRYVTYTSAAVASFVLAETAIGFATARLNEEIYCTEGMDATRFVFSAVFGFLNLFLCLSNFIIYTAMLVCFWYKKRQYASNGATGERNNFMKQQEAVMPTVKFMIFLYFLFGILPKCFINISAGFKETYIFNYIEDIGNILKVVSSLVEFVSLIICSQLFRDSALKLFCRHGNAVHPAL